MADRSNNKGLQGNHFFAGFSLRVTLSDGGNYENLSVICLENCGKAKNGRKILDMSSTLAANRTENNSL